MACSLPPVLFILYFYFKRKWNSKMLLEKIPFFIVAVILGLMSIHAAASTHTIADNRFYSFPERILFACFNLLAYIGKLIAPLNLSAFYPYPDRINGSVPSYFYAAPLAVIILGFLIVRSLN